jgi:hypothetical protein
MSSTVQCIRVYACLFGVVLLCALQPFAPQRAHAQLAHGVLAGDANLGVPVKAPYVSSGPGFGLRLGTRFGFPSALETLELGFDYATFAETSANSGTNNTAFSAYRGVVGARLGLDGVLRPGLFAHCGIGHVTGQVVVQPTGSDPRTIALLTHTGFTWDGGAYLDLAPTSFLELGVQVSYVHISPSAVARSFQWLMLGAHLALVF